ncbi:MAG: TetR/AcrR family transcriptional regulator [Bacilli bacterium]|nr:TetR/AcrR family transcriptional regulator [Bacilli bacterium]
MAKYNEREILDFFKKCILENGYENTSMRFIASHFKMPVSSLYRHFSSKEEMLEWVIQPVLDIFNSMYEKYKDKNYEFLRTMTLEEVFDNQRTPSEFIDLMYRYHDEFSILLSHLKGTKYENFFDKLVDYEVKTSLEFFAELKKCGFKIREIDPRHLRILTENNFNAYFSVIKNNLTHQEALDFMAVFSDYATAGYKGLFIER